MDGLSKAGSRFGCAALQLSHSGTARVRFASSGVAQTGRNAVNGAGDGAVDGVGVFAGALAAEQVDLDEAHGVDVGIAQPDGAGEDLVFLEQLALAGDGENGGEGSLELCLELRKNAIAKAGIGDERGVQRGDAEVGFG